MTDIILHHYPASPFSEKIRAILGYKQLAWKSVHIPVVMPKPELTPLTGGYRKTPVMQVGADIYCDTSLMARVLERIKPSPAIFPQELAASAMLHAEWADHVLFFLTIPLVFEPGGMAHLMKLMGGSVMSQFQKDRETLFSGGTARRPARAASRSQLPGYLTAINSQLATQPFLLGDAPTIADFATYHPLWFVFSNPGIAATFDAYGNIKSWYQRIAAFGHGQVSSMTGEEALALARESKPADIDAGDMPDPTGLKLGDSVVISATDYGTDPVTGILVRSSISEIAVQRRDERAGDVVVHFPRVGFKMVAAT